MFSYSLGFSQNLTIDEIIGLRKKNIATIEEYLIGKNWSFISAKEPTDEKLGSILFAYKRNSEYKDHARAYINFYYSENSNTERLNVQVEVEEVYNKYVTRLKMLGYKMISSKVEEGKIVKIYQKSSTSVMVIVQTYNDSPSYNFLVSDNDDLFKFQR